MPIQRIIQQVGPLPIAQTFNAPVDGPVTFFMAGTGRSPSADQWIGANLVLDGLVIGGISVFCDKAQIHRSMITNLFSANLSMGAHKMTVDLMNTDTLTDNNDGFVVVLMY